jgi:hypothetical protein
MRGRCMQAMRALFNILTLYVALTFSSCRSHFAGSSIQKTAFKIINEVDSNSIKLFHAWNYVTRDTAMIWTKISSDSQLYSCSFYKYQDFSRLDVFEPFGFIVDFPSTYHFDTARYWRFSFFNRNDTIFEISSTENLGDDLARDTVVILDKLFPANNPFKKFDSLSSLVGRLKINGISYREDIGNFVQFSLDSGYNLTYLPTDLNLNPRSKEPWLEDFRKGTYLTPNWNLRKP